MVFVLGSASVKVGALAFASYPMSMGRARSMSEVKVSGRYEAEASETVAVFVCPRCRAHGPFEHLIEVTQAIEVVFTASAYRPYAPASQRHSIVEDAEAREEKVSEAGYRCGSCGERFDRPVRV
jgi:predicted RNA-binding Zn-ribbon protein involved in translation (DUF1610 family)